jgi:hypothetical protein
VPSRGRYILSTLRFPRFVLIGNPSSRRVAHFANAVVSGGCPPPRLISWLDLARQGPALLESLPDGPLLLRMDSFGEDFEVERALLERGYLAVHAMGGPSVLDPREVASLRFERGRILAPRQVHEGFLSVLSDLEQVLARRPGWRVLTPLPAVREMFDKGATSKTLSALGIPVARSLEAPATARALRAQLREAHIQAAWVKLACGSSASCLALWELGRSSETLITTMERTPQGLFNSRRVRRYARPADIEHLVDFVLREGAHVEENVPKATLRDRWIDCRVVAVAGAEEHIVLRSSRYPITNLHIGAVRGDLSMLAGRCPDEILHDALASCRRILQHYDALHVGVDLAFTRGFRSHAVLEVNAFGDFVHGLTLGEGGVYASELRALTHRHS